ncbi:MAG: hypothetical protein ACLUEQ_09355 [Cloacibacillus evryensis]
MITGTTAYRALIAHEVTGCGEKEHVMISGEELERWMTKSWRKAGRRDDLLALPP